jgi:hypothetical protein
MQGKKNATIMSPDFAISACRNRAEKCLESHEEGEDYTYKGNGKRRDLTLTEDDGCNRVCLGIETIVDADDEHGNNNLPRGFILIQGTLNRAQVEILKYIHENGRRYTDGVTRFDATGIRYSLIPKASDLLKRVTAFMSKGATVQQIFHNCQSFARDFCYRPEKLYSELYGIDYDKTKYPDSGLGYIQDKTANKQVRSNTMKQVMDGTYARGVLRRTGRVIGRAGQEFAQHLERIGEDPRI